AYYAALLRGDVAQDTGDGLDWLTPDEYRALVAWTDELGALPADVPQAAWSVPARMLADRIAESRGLNAILVRPFVAAFLREVGRYLRPDVADRLPVRAAVAGEIRDHRPHVVIAHSLGSVVAYETLWAH